MRKDPERISVKGKWKMGEENVKKRASSPPPLSYKKRGSNTVKCVEESHSELASKREGSGRREKTDC